MPHPSPYLKQPYFIGLFERHRLSLPHPTALLRKGLGSNCGSRNAECRGAAAHADPDGCGFVIGERLVLDQKVLTSSTVGSSWGASLQVCDVSPEYPLRLLACV